MADRIEREIEEILAKLEDGPTAPSAEARRPISIQSRRKKAPGPISRLRASLSSTSTPITPPTLLFVGAGLLIAGLVLSTFSSPLLWVSFVGIVLFLGAFVWSFMRSSRPGSSAGRPAAPTGHYWRDRYIAYEPETKGPLDKVKRRFRK